MNSSMTGLPVPPHPMKFAQVHVHCVGNAIYPSHPLIPLLFLPSIFPSIRGFSNEPSVHIRWPKYWNFSSSINSSSEYSGLISLNTDWFDMLPVQGTLRNLLQHHSSKVSILGFTVHLSQKYVTFGKTIVLTVQIFISKVMSLLFSTLSRFIITFLPRSKRLLILWLQSPSAPF